MDIILLQRIEKLGSIGDVVTVKDGYARNFLLPQKKALRANEANKKVFEANRDRLEKENAERRTEAEKSGEKVAGEEIILIRAASNTGQLYGSVSVRDIVDALVEDGAGVGATRRGHLHAGAHRRAHPGEGLRDHLAREGLHPSQ